jgi:hypothetical protein
MIAEHADAAMVWCPSVEAPSIGSGLLIARNLVLTAQHVVREKVGHLKVRFVSGSPAPIAVSVVWESEIEDLALLQINGGTWDPSYVYRFVDIESSFPISSAMVTGFPTATRDQADFARDYTVYGEIRRDGPGQLSFSVPIADTPNHGADWAGISGGVVCRQRVGKVREIFGVVEEIRPQFRDGKLFIAPVSRTALTDSFKALVEGGGSTFELSVLDGSVRRKALDAYPFLSSLYDFARTPAPNQFAKQLDFEIDATFCSNFEQLKQIIRYPNEGYERIAPRGLLPNPSEEYPSVYLYIQAPGGYGKSTLVRRLISAAIGRFCCILPQRWPRSRK